MVLVAAFVFCKTSYKTAAITVTLCFSVQRNYQLVSLSTHFDSVGVPVFVGRTRDMQGCANQSSIHEMHICELAMTCWKLIDILAFETQV